MEISVRSSVPPHKIRETYLQINDSGKHCGNIISAGNLPAFDVNVALNISCIVFYKTKCTVRFNSDYFCVLFQ